MRVSQHDMPIRLKSGEVVSRRIARDSQGKRWTYVDAEKIRVEWSQTHEIFIQQ